MYLNGQKQWVAEVIQQKGTSLRTNEEALIPFHGHLGFATVARRENTQVAEGGGKPFDSNSTGERLPSFGNWNA